MDLKIVREHKDDQTLYKSQLTGAIDSISPDLLAEDIWTKRFVEEAPYFINRYVGQNRPIRFDGMPELLALELKLYWANLLRDPRSNSASSTDRRRLPMDWFRLHGEAILDKFASQSLAGITHPEFPLDGYHSASAKRQHNPYFIELFQEFVGGSIQSETDQSYIKSGGIEVRTYKSPRITIAGDFHKGVFVAKEQFKPITKRNIIFLNDLYSENDTRFKDTQRQNDSYLNFYLYPEWLRAAIKEHVLQKVSHGELAPKTLKAYFGRFGFFRDFMYESFASPSALDISDNLIEDRFVAWGNEKGLSGKNWFTDNLAMLNTASRAWPDQWPALSVSGRATKKIEKVHYKEGLGRIGHNQESANRAYSQRLVDEIRGAINDTPIPVPAIFGIILATGIRAEDGHAILFDCLRDDPGDENFMLLTFWQNKVRKWNQKPLLKSDPTHAALIEIVTQQRNQVIGRHGRPTKYLFPQFSGTKESFLLPSYTLKEIRRQCILHQIQSDDGSPLSFSWHALRHTKGTSLAKDGHDILSIMMELGHASPDMATVYINNRLELKKKALLENGGGRFYTIEGKVDKKVAELLVRKEQISATRVCGGACAMPSQLGDWCEHANACYTCKHYRADETDVEFFKYERAAVSLLIEEQHDESNILKDIGRGRMSEITERRLRKNKEVYKSLGNIIQAIEIDGRFKGDMQNCKQIALETDE